MKLTRIHHEETKEAIYLCEGCLKDFNTDLENISIHEQIESTDSDGYKMECHICFAFERIGNLSPEILVSLLHDAGIKAILDKTEK